MRQKKQKLNSKGKRNNICKTPCNAFAIQKHGEKKKESE